MNTRTLNWTDYKLGVRMALLLGLMLGQFIPLLASGWLVLVYVVAALWVVAAFVRDTGRDLREAAAARAATAGAPAPKAPAPPDLRPFHVSGDTIQRPSEWPGNPREWN